MKITKLTFDGNPEEFKSIADLFLAEASDAANVSPLTGSASPEGDDHASSIVTPEDAYRSLITRTTIHPGQRDLYKILAGGELEWSEYISRMGRTPEQMRGVHGALGRRIAGTPAFKDAGLPQDSSAVMIIRYDKNGTSYVSLKEDFIKVLHELGLA